MERFFTDVIIPFKPGVLLIRFKPSLIPAVGWSLVITVLLCLPGKEFPLISWLNKIWFDKWVHILLFLVLVIVWSRSLFNKNYKSENLVKLFIWISLTSFAYGVLMEIVQHYFVPFRAFEIGDIIADAAGSLAGYLISVRIYKKN